MKKSDRDLGLCQFGCERPAVYVEAGCCHVCYVGLRYWMRKKSPTKIFRRQKQLGVLSRRMEALTNVRHISTAPKRAQARRRA